MKIIDLSHTIHQRMPVYPGTEPPIIESANTLAKDGFVEAKLTMYSHTGTHVDAPAHLIKNGSTLDMLNIEHFYGPAVIIDCTEKNSSLIEKSSLLKYEELLSVNDFVIIKTGWSKYWGSNDYFGNYPTLSEEAAKWLAGFKLKGIGIDAISIDPIKSKLENHHVFLGKGTIIIENLTNLDAVTADSFKFSCLPLKTENSDGSPVRAIAIV